MSGRIIVPMPTAEGYYGTRDRLVLKYGEASVNRAEIAICINVLQAIGIIKQGEFVSLLVDVLEKTEEARKRQAGIE